MNVFFPLFFYFRLFSHSLYFFPSFLSFSMLPPSTFSITSLIACCSSPSPWTMHTIMASPLISGINQVTKDFDILPKFDLTSKPTTTFWVLGWSPIQRPFSALWDSFNGNADDSGNQQTISLVMPMDISGSNRKLWTKIRETGLWSEKKNFTWYFGSILISNF